jgi:CBS domain-containing protein
VHQDYEADVLTQVTVAETMEKDAPVIEVGTKVGELAERIARHDPAVARYEALLIQNDGRLVGIVTRGDILRALDKDSTGMIAVEEAGSTNLVVTYPDELVSDAAAKMLHREVGRLPVVERGDERKVLGYLGRSAIMAARTRRLRDEHFREPGWWGLRGLAPRKYRNPEATEAGNEKALTTKDAKDHGGNTATPRDYGSERGMRSPQRAAGRRYSRPESVD